GHLVREYGMTELTSHFYTRVLSGGDPDLFVPPPWTRVRTLDPETLAPVTGRPGLLAVFDLANVGSAVHLLTEDLAVDEVEAFRLAGRAAGADLRGCSLTVEELAG
ncbi:MAG: acyl-protein synthetase, partial [Thermoanaerobaculia bacterium]|nr:acyl-protein synthetase [Thermoanaerobaculia bacterium]